MVSVFTGVCVWGADPRSARKCATELKINPPHSWKICDSPCVSVDVDECVKSGVCLDGRCVNTEGSFQCQCDAGFTTNPERTACLGTQKHVSISPDMDLFMFPNSNFLVFLSDVDECVSSGGSVCGSRRCENTIGSYHCLTSCEPGYRVTQTGTCVGESAQKCINLWRTKHDTQQVEIINIKTNVEMKTNKRVSINK